MEESRKKPASKPHLRPFLADGPIRLRKRPQGKEPKPSLGVPKKWETKPRRKSLHPLWIRQFIPSSKQIWNPELNEGIMVFPYPYYKSPTKSIPAYAIVRYHLVDGEIEWMPRFVHHKKKTTAIFDLTYIETDLVQPVIEALQAICGYHMPTREEIKIQGRESSEKLREDEVKKRIMKFRL